MKQTKVLEFGKRLRIKKGTFDKGRERQRDRETTYGLKVGVFASRNESKPLGKTERRDGKNFQLIN